MIKYLLFLLFGTLVILPHKPPSEKFRRNQCVVSKLDGKVRKVIKVNKYMYNYCIISYNKCEDKIYSMRKKSFNKLMKLSECK